MPYYPNPRIHIGTRSERFQKKNVPRTLATRSPLLCSLRRRQQHQQRPDAEEEAPRALPVVLFIHQRLSKRRCASLLALETLMKKPKKEVKHAGNEI